MQKAFLLFCLLLSEMVVVKGFAQGKPALPAATVLLNRLIHFGDVFSYRYEIQDKHGDTLLSTLKGVAFIAPQQSFAFSGSTADATIISEKAFITVLYEPKKLRIDTFSSSTQAKNFLGRFQSGGSSSFMSNGLIRNSSVSVLPANKKGQVKYLIIPLKGGAFKRAEVLIDKRADSLVSLFVEQENLLLPGRSADRNALITKTFYLTQIGKTPPPEVLPFYVQRATLSSYCKDRFANFKIITQ